MRWLWLFLLFGCTAGQLTETQEIARVVNNHLIPIQDQIDAMPKDQNLSPEQMTGIGASILAGLAGLNTIRSRTRKKALAEKP